MNNYKDVLNLSDGFDPFGRGVRPARMFQFPGGEWHVDVGTILPRTKSVLITVRLLRAEHIMQVLLAADALRRHGVQRIGLYTPYFPYARQDRVAVVGDPLSISVMANLINSCKFDAVYILDAHSSVTPALIKNVQELDWESWVVSGPMSWIENWVTNWRDGKSGLPALLLAPDAGSAKKVDQIAHNLKLDVVVARKYRDPGTGEVSTVLPGKLNGRHVVIIDDICDGGATFTSLAQHLSSNSYSVHLVVTHGIFSKGLGPLFDAGFMSVHASESFGGPIAAFADFHVHGVPLI